MINKDELVETVARAIGAERERVRRENDAVLAAAGFWPDHHKQLTDEQCARAALDAAQVPQMRARIEETISAWAFAHNIDGAARNDLFARLRAALTKGS